MKKTKVVHLTSVHPPDDVRIFQKQCRSLAREGYDVELVAPGTEEKTIDGVRIVGIPSSHNRLPRMLLTGWSVFREAVRRDGAVYHFHDPELLPWGLLLRMTGRTVIYDAHENLPEMILRKEYLPKLGRRPLRWFVKQFENFCSRWFSAVIGATPAIEARFAKLNPRTISILNTALPAEFEKIEYTPWKQRQLSVAYTGRIQKANCIEEIISAMSLIPSFLPASLTLAGRFDSGALREHVMVQPGWSRVNYLGVVHRSCISGILGQCRGGLILSPADPECIESLPNKLFEYMAAGIPVIASNFPRWKQIVERAKCGIVVDSARPNEIADAIVYVLTHSAEAERMGRAGREAVEREYNWGFEERRLMVLYAELCGHP